MCLSPRQGWANLRSKDCVINTLGSVVLALCSIFSASPLQAEGSIKICKQKGGLCSHEALLRDTDIRISYGFNLSQNIFVSIFQIM